MTDIATLFDPATLTADWALQGADLAGDGSLRTPILLSLLTDARARDEDLARMAPGADPRGAWSDGLAEVEGDRTGSRLWTLRREKETNETLNRARTIAEEALAWLVEDEIAVGVTVEAEWLEPGWLGLGVTVQVTGETAERYDFEVSV